MPSSASVNVTSKCTPDIEGNEASLLQQCHGDIMLPGSGLAVATRLRRRVGVWTIQLSTVMLWGLVPQSPRKPRPSRRLNAFKGGSAYATLSGRVVDRSAGTMSEDAVCLAHSLGSAAVDPFDIFDALVEHPLEHEVTTFVHCETSAQLRLNVAVTSGPHRLARAVQTTATDQTTIDNFIKDATACVLPSVSCENQHTGHASHAGLGPPLHWGPATLIDRCVIRGVSEQTIPVSHRGCRVFAKTRINIVALANHLKADSQVPTLDRNWLARHLANIGMIRPAAGGGVIASLCQMLNTPLLLVDAYGSRAAEINFKGSDVVIAVDVSSGDLLAPLSEASRIMCEPRKVANQWPDVLEAWTVAQQLSHKPAADSASASSNGVASDIPKVVACSHEASSNIIPREPLDEYELATASLDCLTRSHCHELMLRPLQQAAEVRPQVSATTTENEDNILIQLINSLDGPAQVKAPPGTHGPNAGDTDTEMAHAVATLADQLSLEHGTTDLDGSPDDSKIIEDLALAVTVENAIHCWRSCFAVITLRNCRMLPAPSHLELRTIAEELNLGWPLVALTFATDQPYKLCAMLSDFESGVHVGGGPLRALFQEATDEEYIDCLSIFHMVGLIFLNDDGTVTPGAVLQRWGNGHRSPFSKLCAEGCIDGLALSQYESMFLESCQYAEMPVMGNSKLEHIAAVERAMCEFSRSLHDTSRQHAPGSPSETVVAVANAADVSADVQSENNTGTGVNRGPTRAISSCPTT